MPRPLGTTSLRILAAVRDGARYGLDIVRQTGLPSGTVYPTLGRLEARGQLRSRWEEQGVADQEGRPRRKFHELTPDGAQALADGIRRISMVASELAPDPNA